VQLSSLAARPSFLVGPAPGEPRRYGHHGRPRRGGGRGGAGGGVPESRIHPPPANHPRLARARLSTAFDEISTTPEIDWGLPVTNGRTDGPMVYLPSPQAPPESDASRALLDLYQLPELEALACRFL
jgi:hypothetical protein